VNRIAQVLLDEGVGPGVTVGVQLPNTVEIAATFLAIVRLGAIVVPFPVQYRSHELTELSKVAALKVFVTTTRIGRREAAVEMASLQPNIPTLERVLAFGSNVPEGVVDLDGRVAAAVDRSGLEAFNSSFVPTRTTASPSAGLQAPRARQRASAHALRLLAMSWTTVEGPQLTKDDVLLNPFPMVNMAGINGMFLPWLRVAGYSSNTTPSISPPSSPGCQAWRHLHRRTSGPLDPAAPQRAAARRHGYLDAAAPRIGLDATRPFAPAGLA